MFVRAAASWWLLLLATLPLRAYGGPHSYKDGEYIKLYANKVGPFSNPSETYQYYDMPFCRPPEGLKHKPETLGEVVDGNRLIATPYNLTFKIDQEHTVLCTKTLNAKEIQQFRKAVREDYYFQMYYDDLPIWGFIGKVEKVAGSEEHQYSIFTHVHFDISYNKDKVIEINVATDPKALVDISESVTAKGDDIAVNAEFSYSVKWKETPITWDRRMDKYRRYQFLPQHLEIHWFSIINSSVTVLLLTGFLATILMRVLKNDFVKYTRDEEGVLEDNEETGWKYIHGDVFRFPPQLNLFCAFIGTGTQLFVLAICIFMLACIGAFYPYNRGALYTALIVLYAATAGISGYIAASLYRQMEGKSWVRNILLTCFIYCGPFFLMFCFANTVAIVYRSTAALPFGTIVIILVIWMLITIPLTIIGGILGKNQKKDFFAPCRTNKFPREIPYLPWYRHAVPQMIMADVARDKRDSEIGENIRTGFGLCHVAAQAFLPFSAIYIELYYIFASVWGHKVYTIYSILFIVFIILIIVTAFITIALTYFQLAVEDHRWWWRSFLCGGSTGLFVYGYCFYYYLARSDMSGFMQTSFFFGYMLMVCYAFFVMLGTVGWRASLMFVRHIYRAIKCE